MEARNIYRRSLEMDDKRQGLVNIAPIQVRKYRLKEGTKFFYRQKSLIQPCRRTVFYSACSCKICGAVTGDLIGDLSSSRNSTSLEPSGVSWTGFSCVQKRPPLRAARMNHGCWPLKGLSDEQNER